MKLQWSWKKFSDLTVDELYGIIQLRENVFVVGQNCVYLDCDDMDQQSFHLSGYKDGKLVAYLRVIPAGIKYEEVSFGRVATSPEHRGLGFGKELTKKALENIQQTYGKTAVRISAQSYLKKFYADFGFKQMGEEYLEVGIPHIEMVKP
jgi:ElaA protein